MHLNLYVHNCRYLECIKLWPCGFLIGIQIFIPSWKTHIDYNTPTVCMYVNWTLSLCVFVSKCACVDCNRFSPFGHTVPNHSNLHPSFPLFAQRPPHTHTYCNTHTHTLRTCVIHIYLLVLHINHTTPHARKQRSFMQSWSFMRTKSSPKNTCTRIGTDCLTL